MFPLLSFATARETAQTEQWSKVKIPHSRMCESFSYKLFTTRGESRKLILTCLAGCWNNLDTCNSVRCATSRLVPLLARTKKAPTLVVVFAWRHSVNFI